MLIVVFLTAFSVFLAAPGVAHTGTHTVQQMGDDGLPLGSDPSQEPTYVDTSAWTENSDPGQTGKGEMMCILSIRQRPDDTWGYWTLCQSPWLVNTVISTALHYDSTGGSGLGFPGGNTKQRVIPGGWLKGFFYGTVPPETFNEPVMHVNGRRYRIKFIYRYTIAYHQTNFTEEPILWVPERDDPLQWGYDGSSAETPTSMYEIFASYHGPYTQNQFQETRLPLICDEVFNGGALCAENAFASHWNIAEDEDPIPAEENNEYVACSDPDQDGSYTLNGTEEDDGGIGCIPANLINFPTDPLIPPSCGTLDVVCWLKKLFVPSNVIGQRWNSLLNSASGHWPMGPIMWVGGTVKSWVTTVGNAMAGQSCTVPSFNLPILDQPFSMDVAGCNSSDLEPLVFWTKLASRVTMVILIAMTIRHWLAEQPS